MKSLDSSVSMEAKKKNCSGNLNNQRTIDLKEYIELGFLAYAQFKQTFNNLPIINIILQNLYYFIFYTTFVKIFLKKSFIQKNTCIFEQNKLEGYSNLRSHRLVVRTRPSQGCNTSSNLVGITNTKSPCKGDFFIGVQQCNLRFERGTSRKKKNNLKMLFFFFRAKST